MRARLPHIRLIINSASSSEHGQILLIVVLLLVVVSTIGLSLATRSITNQRQSNEDKNSQQAFSAAEAGIQVALQSSSDAIQKQLGNNAMYTAKIKSIAATDIAINGGNTLIKNEGVDIWLTDYPAMTSRWDNGTITLYWGNPTSTGCSEAALEIALLSGDSITDPILKQYAYDSCGNERQPANNFTTTGIEDVSNQVLPDTVEGKYRYRVTLPTVISKGILMRIVPLYANTRLAVSASKVLPVQGKVVESTGSSGGTQRKIVLVKGNPKVPLELFPYVLFTPQGQ